MFDPQWASKIIPRPVPAGGSWRVSLWGTIGSATVSYNSIDYRSLPPPFKTFKQAIMDKHSNSRTCQWSSPTLWTHQKLYHELLWICDAQLPTASWLLRGIGTSIPSTACGRRRSCGASMQRWGRECYICVWNVFGFCFGFLWPSCLWVCFGSNWHVVFNKVVLACDGVLNNSAICSWNYAELIALMFESCSCGFDHVNHLRCDLYQIIWTKSHSQKHSEPRWLKKHTHTQKPSKAHLMITVDSDVLRKLLPGLFWISKAKSFCARCWSHCRLAPNALEDTAAWGGKILVL